MIRDDTHFKGLLLSLRTDNLEGKTLPSSGESQMKASEQVQDRKMGKEKPASLHLLLFIRGRFSILRCDHL